MHKKRREVQTKTVKRHRQTPATNQVLPTSKKLDESIDLLYCYFLKFGDFISVITGKQFLLTSSRYNSMTEDYLTPMDKTIKTLGEPIYSMDEGVELTIKWINSVEE